MKFILITTLALSSLTVWSHNHEEMDKKMASMSFEDAKKMKTEMIAHKRAALDEHEKCITAATDKPGLKACKKEWHDDMKEMKNKAKKK